MDKEILIKNIKKQKNIERDRDDSVVQKCAKFVRSLQNLYIKGKNYVVKI